MKRILMVGLVLISFLSTSPCQTPLLEDQTLINLLKPITSGPAICATPQNEVAVTWCVDTFGMAWFQRSRVYDTQGKGKSQTASFYIGDFPTQGETIAANDTLVYITGISDWNNSGKPGCFAYAYARNAFMQHNIYHFGLPNTEARVQTSGLYEQFAYAAIAASEEGSIVYKKDISNFGVELDTLHLSAWELDNADENAAFLNEDTISVLYNPDSWNTLELASYNFNGAPLSSYTLLDRSEYPDIQTYRPLLHKNGVGQYYLVWLDHFSDGGEGDAIRIQKFTPDGMPIGIDVVANRNTSKLVGDVQVAGDIEGRMAITWEDTEEQSDNNKKVYMQLLTSDLKIQGQEILIADGIPNQDFSSPQVCFIEDTIVSVWYQNQLLYMSTYLWDTTISPEDPQNPEEPEDPDNPEDPDDPEDPGDPDDPDDPDQPSGVFINGNSVQSGDMIILYPNPVVDELNLLFNKGCSGRAIIHIHDLGGKLVCEETLRDCRNEVHKMQIGHLNNGIYFINITTEANSIMKKIVIQ